MRLYHLGLSICLAAFSVMLISGCSAPVATQPAISVSITADGQSVPVELLPGSSVEQALKKAYLALNDLDNVDPPLYSLVSDGDQISVTRVTEEFEVEQETIPFEQLRQPTVFLPEGQLQLDPIQKGEPGEDFEGVSLLEGGSGEIDKHKNPELTHLTDAIGYYIHERHPLGGSVLAVSA